MSITVPALVICWRTAGMSAPSSSNSLRLSAGSSTSLSHLPRRSLPVRRLLRLSMGVHLGDFAKARNQTPTNPAPQPVCQQPRTSARSKPREGR